MGINGEGIGYWNGLTVFVEGLLPGERARVRLDEKRKNYGRAKVLQQLTESSDRVTPQCSLFGKCGGCQLMHLQYAEQLKAKRQRVQDALERIGKFHGIFAFPCSPSPQPLAYRNKIQLPAMGGELGLYAKNSHRLIPVEHCYIHSSLGQQAFEEVKLALKTFPQAAEIQHVLIKSALYTKEILVVFVTTKKEVLGLSNLAERLLASRPQIKGVMQNVHVSKSNTVLGGSFHTLAGQGWIEEVLCGLTFKISPASFFQVNPSQAEKLYQKVLELADLNGGETVLDAYCGVGTLTLILAPYAKEVIGVECIPEAIKDAKDNAERNQIHNTRFYSGFAEEFISLLHEVDVAILNPPRKGCASSFLESLTTLRPRRVIYVSCDPATLARDLRFLCDRGYHLDGVHPFDMFPQTAHVECVAICTCGL